MVRLIKLKITFVIAIWLLFLYFCVSVCVESVMGANTPVFFSGLMYLQHLVWTNGTALLCFVGLMVWLMSFYLFEATTRATPKKCYKKAYFYYANKALSFIVASYIFWLTIQTIDKFLTYTP